MKVTSVCLVAVVSVPVSFSGFLPSLFIVISFVSHVCSVTNWHSCNISDPNHLFDFLLLICLCLQRICVLSR